jgi:CRISPR-associated Csx3 family protein
MGDTPRTIDLSDIINAIKKEKEEIKLPNGSKKVDYNWSGRDLPAIDEYLRSLGLGRADHVLVTNVRVGWLALAITHGVHPAFVSLADDKVEGGRAAIGCADPSGTGKGEGIEFKVTDDKEEYVLVEYNIPGGTFDIANLTSLAPPDIRGKGVIISGRGSNWLTVSMAMAYHGSAKWVGLFQPGVGATVAMTHSPERKLGDVIKI